MQMVNSRKGGLRNPILVTETPFFSCTVLSVIKTGQKSLKYLLESRLQNRNIQLWALRMAGYNCKIENIEGTTNTCADLDTQIT